MASRYPSDLMTLIAFLKKLPGVGTRTAERFAFEFMNWPQKDLQMLGQLLEEIHVKIPLCACCGCLTDSGKCFFCDVNTRDASQICLIASPRDVFAIESTQSYRGLYHVVEHLLSPLDGRHAHQLRVDRIEERIRQHETQEVILAFDSTLEGDTTALYLKNHLSALQVKISRLAFGLPIGSSLEYIDGGTLARSLKGRQVF